MATTTPNFGWAVPTSTDLVKDGTVAIETLGDSIDASLVDLKGGTTGQVLSKATNTDMDFSWITPSSGGATFAGCYLQRSANQTISNNTLTSVTWDTETLDSNAYHSTSTNTDRITIPSGKAGKYMVGFTLTYTGSSTGIRVGQIRKNGTSVSQTNIQSISGAGNTVLSKTHVIDLTVGDYIDLQAYQNSGGNLDLLANAADVDLSAFYAYYIGA
jgi:hypothetical protein